MVKVNELPVREALGFTGHHPRWALAFKFEAPEAESVVERIEVQVGRTGRITPVARIRPVKLSGSTIANATLHNQDYVDLLELAIGDRVSISKRGDVIPAVERVIEKNELGNSTWKMPPSCPSCRTGLVVQGAHHFCPNPDCPDQVQRPPALLRGPRPDGHRERRPGDPGNPDPAGAGARRAGPVRLRPRRRCWNCPASGRRRSS